mgnify:CR=1 FL=1
MRWVMRWVLVVPAFFVGSLGGGYLASLPFLLLISLSNFIVPSIGVMEDILVTTTQMVQAFFMGLGGVWLAYRTAPWGKGSVAVAAAIATSAIAVLSLIGGMASHEGRAQIEEQYGSLLVAGLALMVHSGAGWYSVIMRKR